MRRIASIESFRCLAVLGVICIHTKPFMRDIFPTPAFRLPEYLFNQPPRVAVPFFFVVSGYLLAKKTLPSHERQARMRRYLRRLLRLLAIWTVIYTLVPSFWPALGQTNYLQIVAQQMRGLLGSPCLLLFEGGKVHLWYLPALLTGVALLWLGAPGGRAAPALFLAVPLFVVGLLGGSYRHTPLGLHLPLVTRDGPFLSLICLTTGALIRQRGVRLSVAGALALTGTGLALHLLESWFLWRYYQVPWLYHDYLLGTVVAANGLLLLALARPELGRRSGLAALGRYTLGVYLCHYLFVDLLGPFTYLFEIRIWQLLFPLLVYLLSLGLTVILGRFPWSRPLVS